MSNSNFSFRPHSKKPNKKNENDRSKILIALFFLLLSFSCIFCSSQGALWFISEDRVEASILSNRRADYDVDLAVAAAPLNRDTLATEIYQDTILLQQTVTTSGVGNAIVMVIPTPLSSPTPIPVAQLLPTLTPTPVPPPTATPNPTSPPVSTVPPTVAPPTSPPPIPATSTLEPPTPIPPTPIPPTPIPPTPIPPTPIPPTPIPPTPTNTPPTVVNDTATTDEDTPVLINILSNDTDSDGIDPTTVTIISAPANGGVVVNGAGQVTYTPNGNYSGNDSFSYRVCDNDGACATATVSITVNPVNDPPVAVDDTSATANGLPITITVLSNDSDPDVGDILSVIAVGSSSSGTISINADNTVTYTPTAGITGMHTFTYTIQDSGGLTDSAVVSVTVTTPPVAVDDYDITAEDITRVIDVLSNDTDLDGDPLTVTFVSVPGHGTVTINIPAYTVTYVPAPNYYGFDTFTYTISDGIYTDTATVTILVVPVNDPPVAVDDSYSTTVSSTLTIAAPGLLSNDSDIEGQTLTVNLTSVTTPSGGMVGVTADGGFNYTAPSVAGSYTFTYRAQDIIGGVPGAVSNVATVTITVDSP